MARFAAVAFGLSVLFTSVPSLAHTFSAPSQVRAAANGDFHYVATLSVGPGGAGVSSSSWHAELNVSPLGIVGDGDCEFTLPQGSSDTVNVFGKLVDPNSPGRVRTDYAVCGNPGTQFFTAVTTIIPFTAPAVPLGSHGTSLLLALGLLLSSLQVVNGRAPRTARNAWQTA